MVQTVLLSGQKAAILPLGIARKNLSASCRQVSVRAEEPKVVREYREDDDKMINSSASGSSGAPKNPNSAYIDDLPEVCDLFSVFSRLLWLIVSKNLTTE